MPHNARKTSQKSHKQTQQTKSARLGDGKTTAKHAVTTAQNTTKLKLQKAYMIFKQTILSLWTTGYPGRESTAK